MSRHYRPGESDDLDFVQPAVPAASVGSPIDQRAEADDDPGDSLDDINEPEYDERADR
jgi:hypothetical protein